MKSSIYLCLLSFLFLACGGQQADTQDEAVTEETSTSTQDEGDGWTSIFDGATFNGWKVNENDATFSIQDGAIVANGERSHLFYDGEVAGHNFKNFEFKAQVMTLPNSNAGIYFHTAFQEEGWPSKGYEVHTHSDWRKTGGLYAIDDVKEPPTKDNEWFTQHIIVKGKNIEVRLNGETVVNYTEPDKPERPEGMENRLLDRGTFALQGHDPGSTVHFKDIMVKILPDN